MANFVAQRKTLQRNQKSFHRGPGAFIEDQGLALGPEGIVTTWVVKGDDLKYNQKVA